MNILIRGAEIIDPEKKYSGVNDVLLSDGLISKIDKKITASADETIDADGLLLAPGFIDLHAHFRDPGYEYKETIETGLRAAAAGGYTSVVVMPNTDPPADTAATIQYMQERAADAGLGRLYVAGAISKKREGRELAEMGEMAAQGVVAVTDDGSGVADSQLMRRALEYSKIFNLPVMAHEEDMSLVAGGVMHEGLVSTTLGMKASPAAAEDVMVARDVILAELTGAHLHITHLSTKRSLELALDAQRRGACVTFDVTPHHLTLTDEAVMGFDTSTKVNPPLRPAEHRDALVAALAAGNIQAIGTDHAPHAVHEKEDSFDDAPFGLIGLETAFAVLFTELVLTDKVDAASLIAALTIGPAKILNLPQGRLAPGAPADIALIDPSAAWTVDPAKFHSLGRNCPWNGKKLQGKVVHTIAAGKIIFRDEKLCE